MIGQSVGSDASPLSCFSSAQAPYPSFPPKEAKTCSFRCASSSHRTRFAGLRREPCFPPITAQSVEVTSHTAWESPLQRGFKSHSHKRFTFVFTGESGYTHLPSPTGSHTAAYTAKHGAFWMGGVVSLPSERFARFENPARPGIRTANFAAFGAWLGVLSKNAESLRNSDALMRVAVPKASRPRWAA